MDQATNRTAPTLERVSDYLDHHASRNPEAPFVLHAELRLTYAEARDRVDALSRSLLACGVGRGDRVACYGPPRPEFFLSFLAASSIGAIWLGLNPKYSLEELEFNVRDAAPKVLIGVQAAASARLGEIAGLCDSIEHLVELEELWWPEGQAGSFAANGSKVPRTQLDATRAAVETADPAAVVYTSGSTGRPKGALIPHRGLCLCSVIQQEHWGTGNPPRVVCDLPINHIGALGDICVSTLVAGGAIFFIERFDPAVLLRAIERERLTMWLAVPTMFVLATEAPEWKAADLSSLERVAWSGAAASEALIGKLERLGARLGSSYGMTETVGSVTYTADGDSVEVRAATIGRPDPHYEVRVVRPDGSSCEVEEEGEIVVRGDFVMAGYLNLPDATAEAFRDGWLHTGDIAVMRRDGNLRLCGRIKDMFKSGGYNVYCREVERALEQHPAIDLAAVVGVPDPLWGEVGYAFLVVDDAPNPSELRSFAKEHLANFKVPKEFIFVPELPRLPVGKVDKSTLRARAVEAANRLNNEHRSRG